jgi:hypothetical protein
MKAILGCATLALVIASITIPADAKGCIKGAAIGAAAGHFAGHHDLFGGGRRLCDRPSRGQQARERAAKLPLRKRCTDAYSESQPARSAHAHVRGGAVKFYE